MSGLPAVERVWVGDSIVDPVIGHRSDPVLGADLVFTVIGGSCQVALQGPVTRRVVYPFQPGAQYIGVRFRPGSGSVSDEVEIAELRDGTMPLSQLAGIDLNRLRHKLLEASCLFERGRLVGEELHGSALATRAPSALVTVALETFRTAGHRARIGRIAGDFGVSERTLQRLFRAELGVSPKHAARLARIERLIAELDRCNASPDRSLAALASTAGFYDQAHMTNDVTRVLGITPKSLVRERVAHAEAAREATPSK